MALIYDLSTIFTILFSKFYVLDSGCALWNKEMWINEMGDYPSQLMGDEHQPWVFPVGCTDRFQILKNKVENG